MHWLSNGRIVPILSDVSHIIVMPQILRAAVVGLLRPQGHKFQVTAKGGDRTRWFVEWGVMRPFVVLVGLSIAAVVSAFYVNGKSDTIRYSAPALGWIWYNLIVLTVLCFVCIERPRMRAAERFASRGLAKIRLPDGHKIVQLADLSITGARSSARRRGAWGKGSTWSSPMSPSPRRSFALRRMRSPSLSPAHSRPE